MSKVSKGWWFCIGLVGGHCWTHMLARDFGPNTPILMLICFLMAIPFAYVLWGTVQAFRASEESKGGE